MKTNIKNKALPSQSEVRDRLNYDPLTGDLRWKNVFTNRIKPGDLAGNISPQGYITIKVNGTVYYAHRLIFVWMTGACDSPHVDHVNGNGLDNRWDNLRLATISQNACNKDGKQNTKSGVKGVSYDKRTNRWKSSIRIGGKEIWLGRHNTLDLAREAYAAAAEKYHGEFAFKGDAA